MNDADVNQISTDNNVLIETLDAESTLPSLRPRRAKAQQAIVQPRGKKAPAVLSEFARFVVTAKRDAPTISHKLKTITLAADIPLQSKLVSVDIGDGWIQVLAGQAQDTLAQVGDDQLLRFGVYRSPLEWHNQSLNIPFPMDVAPCTRLWHCRSLIKLFSKSPSVVTKTRAKNLRYVIEKVTRLANAEAELHESMPVHVKTIMRGKKILAFEELLYEVGIRAPDIKEGLVKGFPITGVMPNSGLFDGKATIEEPEMSKVELLRSAGWRVKRAMARTVPSDRETDAMLMAETTEEVAKDWAVGPLTKDEVDAKFGIGNWVAARRLRAEIQADRRLYSLWSEHDGLCH